MVEKKNKITKSYDKAAESLRLALNHTHEALLEMRKWRHPVDAEIAGIAYNIEHKITRLEDLKRSTEELEKAAKEWENESSTGILPSPRSE